jgi:hypothetical protein
MIFAKGSKSKTLRNAGHLPFLIANSRSSRKLEVWVAGPGKILESSTE